jgi:trimeric autotransporter adhesin
MSTKTTFKRIALVAVAALGLGMLSVAPSTAAISGLSVTTGAGSAGNTAGTVADTTTAASINVSALLTLNSDTLTVEVSRKSFPTGGSGITAHLGFTDTTTSTSSYIIKNGGGARLTGHGNGMNTTTVFDSTTAFSSGMSDSYTVTGTGYVGGRFNILLDTATVPTAGAYVYTVIVTPYSAGTAGTAVTADVTITVATLAADVKTIDPSKSTAFINSGTATNTLSDSSVAVVATAATTTHATINVLTKNANGSEQAESVTATLTGPGLICTDAGACGKNLVIAGDGSTAIGIRADGTAGTASIVIKTTTVTFPAKTVTFFAKAAKTITVSVARPVIGVTTTTDVIRATAVDADGNVWGGAAYIYADTAADALIAGSATPAACTFNSARGYHECPVTGTAAGTANLKVIDAATVALATATSASAAVRVSTGSATKASLAFDKATYAPGEKAQIWVTATDAAGLPLAQQTITNLFAAGGITSSTAFSSGSADLTSTSGVIAGATSSTSNTVAGYQVYIVYMPMSSGDVTISATGGTGLAVAGRVAVSATASVVNSSVDAATDAANEATDAANAATDAALAAADAADAATAAAQDASDAVAALSASVSKLISSLRAQITSLTNLVIKIQKKVRA